MLLCGHCPTKLLKVDNWRVTYRHHSKTKQTCCKPLISNKTSQRIKCKQTLPGDPIRIHLFHTPGVTVKFEFLRHGCGWAWWCVVCFGVTVLAWFVFVFVCFDVVVLFFVLFCFSLLTLFFWRGLFLFFVLFCFFGVVCFGVVCFGVLCFCFCLFDVVVLFLFCFCFAFLYWRYLLRILPWVSRCEFCRGSSVANFAVGRPLLILSWAVRCEICRGSSVVNFAVGRPLLILSWVVRCEFCRGSSVANFVVGATLPSQAQLQTMGLFRIWWLSRTCASCQDLRS